VREGAGGHKKCKGSGQGKVGESLFLGGVVTYSANPGRGRSELRTRIPSSRGERVKRKSVHGWIVEDPKDCFWGQRTNSKKKK